MSKPWNMARVASRRELPKPLKMLGPVGAKHDPAAPHHACRSQVDIDDMSVDEGACDLCGYHVCACEQLTRPSPDAVEEAVRKSWAEYVRKNPWIA